MRNLIIASVVMTILFSTCFFLSVAAAEDIMLDITVSTISDGVDKNGQPFKRIGFTQDAELNGIKYQRAAIVMVFGDTIDQLKTIQPGKKAKLIVNKSDYKGRDSYALLAVVK